MEHIVVGSLLVLIIVAAGWLICFYNNMINKKAPADNSWRLLNTQIQNRNDVLKEYIETFSDYANPELILLYEVIQAVNGCLNGQAPCNIMASSLEISQRIDRLETGNLLGYKAADNPGAAQMMHKVEELEARVEKHRLLYNEKAHSYNRFLSRFPNNVAARILGAQRLPIFQDSME